MRLVIDVYSIVNIDMSDMNNILVSNDIFDSVDSSSEYLKQIISESNIDLSSVENSFRRLLILHKKPGLLDEIMSSWNNSFTEIPEMTSLLKRLGSVHNANIALFSNISKEHANKLRTNFNPIYNNCTQHFSFEIGVKKPAKLFYQSFLLSHGEFARALYFDHHQNNVNIGKVFGFRAFKFNLKDYSSLFDASMALETKILKSLGVN